MRGHKKDGEEFKCQIVNKNMAILKLFKVFETNKKYTRRVV
jgi:hypothetical protein